MTQAPEAVMLLNVQAVRCIGEMHASIARLDYGDAWFWRPMADLWAFAAQAVDERDGIGPRDLDRWADDGGRSA